MIDAIEINHIEMPAGRIETATKEMNVRAMGEALGELFVQRAFAGDSKTIALEMIRQVEEAFAEGLPRLSWDFLTSFPSRRPGQAWRSQVRPDGQVQADRVLCVVAQSVRQVQPAASPASRAATGRPTWRPWAVTATAPYFRISGRTRSRSSG